MYIINSRMLSCDIMVIWISVLSGGKNGKRWIFGGELDRAVHSTRIDLGVVRFWGERGADGTRDSDEERGILLAPLAFIRTQRVLQCYKGYRGLHL